MLIVLQPAPSKAEATPGPLFQVATFSITTLALD
jgi:hypothetical protein